MVIILSQTTASRYGCRCCSSVYTQADNRRNRMSSIYAVSKRDLSSFYRVRKQFGIENSLPSLTTAQRSIEATPSVAGPTIPAAACNSDAVQPLISSVSGDWRSNATKVGIVEKKWSRPKKPTHTIEWHDASYMNRVRFELVAMSGIDGRMYRGL